MLAPDDRKTAKLILERHGLQSAKLVEADPQGIANHTWIADDFVLRVSKDARFLEDLLTESVAMPALTALGFNTPPALHFSLESRSGLPPYSIYRRVRGTSLCRIDQLSDEPKFFASYGAQLRALHSAGPIADPLGLLDPAWELDLESLERRASRHGLEVLVKNLSLSVGTYLPCFVHQDLHSENVLVSAEEEPIFIDWGDAGFGDPAADFRYLPVRFLDHALDAYGEIQPEMMIRIALHFLDQFLYCEDNRKRYGVYGDSSINQIREFLLTLSN